MIPVEVKVEIDAGATQLKFSFGDPVRAIPQGYCDQRFNRNVGWAKDE